MCGIVGMMGEFEWKHKEALSDLLFLDTLRGKDSTGLSAVRADRGVATYKYVMPGYEFIDLPHFKDMLKVTDRVWLGHNRFKTTGLISRRNAHPFEVPTEDGERIGMVGVHNGTLDNKYDIPGHNQFGTDSEALLNFMYKEGTKEAISKVRGAWSLVWMNFHDNTLNFLRNKERPMCYTLSEDGKVLIWASEEWMIRVACSRRGIKVGEMRYPNVDTLISFPLYEGKGTIAEPVVEGGLVGLPPREKFQQGWSNGYWSQSDNRATGRERVWTGSGWKEVEETAKKGGSSASEPKEKGREGSSKGQTLGKGDTLIGFGGKRVNKQYAELIVDCGCGWCGAEMSMDRPFNWLDDNTVVCRECLSDTHTRSTDDDEEDRSNIVPLLTHIQRTALVNHFEDDKKKIGK